MISVQEVDKIIAAALLPPRTEKVTLHAALGRVLQQQVVADRAFPPFNRVMMDGIAIRFTDWQSGTRSFRVAGLCAAGAPQGRLPDESGYCLEVMTGAVLPAGADTVVKYEYVTLTDGQAVIDQDHLIKEGQHIHRQGEDRSAGEVLLHPGRLIGPAEIAVLATVGLTRVEVAARPAIAVIATGDELVDIDQVPQPHQIRKSNLYALQTALAGRSFISDTYHIVDDKAGLTSQLTGILARYEVVILSGGVSKGKLDFVPQVLAELGVEKAFHFVAQRPGKPFWFGLYKKGVVFALPGNPVSSFVGLYRYVLPFLYRYTGVEPQPVKAVLAADFTFKPDLTYFLQVRLHFDDSGRLLATPVPGQGSGDLANLLDADAFLELPRGRDLFKQGEVFTCLPYRSWSVK